MRRKGPSTSRAAGKPNIGPQLAALVRRRVYESEYEMRRDRTIGALAFAIVNLLLWLVYQWLIRWALGAYSDSPPDMRYVTAIQLLPWVVNVALVLLALWYRSQIGIGYLILPASILIIGTALAMLLVGSCIVSIPFWLLGPVGPLVFGGLVLFGLIRFGPPIIDEIRKFWSIGEP
jgi:hypothetical protein